MSCSNIFRIQSGFRTAGRETEKSVSTDSCVVHREQASCNRVVAVKHTSFYPRKSYLVETNTRTHCSVEGLTFNNNENKEGQTEAGTIGG